MMFKAHRLSQKCSFILHGFPGNQTRFADLSDQIRSDHCPPPSGNPLIHPSIHPSIRRLQPLIWLFPCEGRPPVYGNPPGRVVTQPRLLVVLAPYLGGSIFPKNAPNGQFCAPLDVSDSLGAKPTLSPSMPLPLPSSHKDRKCRDMGRRRRFTIHHIQV